MHATNVAVCEFTDVIGHSLVFLSSHVC